MFRNYLKIAARNITRHKTSAIVNIGGLGLGLCAFLLLLEYISLEGSTNNPFEYFFVDESFNRLYASERQYSQVFTAAALWAIIIACLGLFGLVTFTVESRTKEIGIRKVLGADVSTIVSLLSKDFLLLVLVAFAIAIPVAWYCMQQWLADFAYHINISWWVFLLAGAGATFIAVSTISFQAVKAAVANPVKSLRTE